jgi:carbamoyltransferase
MTKILGISAFYHDSAASLIVDGDIVACAQEERFTRIKHDKSYPFNSINWILKNSNLNLSDIDRIVFYENSKLKFKRILKTFFLHSSPKSFEPFNKAMFSWLGEKIFYKKNLIRLLQKHDKNFNDKNKIFFVTHHFSHAASAFYPSPYEEAIILTIDGVGEFATTSVAIGKKNIIKNIKEIHFPDSLGMLYSAFTYYIGFKVNSGEYKLMGLAPYGIPRYKNLILKNLIDVKQDGSFKINQKYFDYLTGSKMINENFEKLFGQKRKLPDEEITQFHMDIAASIQNVIEEIIVKICIFLKKEFKINNLCLAGGVALNCVVNSKIIENNIFENTWVQPASGDAGGALGAALGYWFQYLKKDRKLTKDDSMKNSYLGPEYSENEIKNQLVDLGANFSILSEDEISSTVSNDLSNSLAVGWFQGKAEFGPRSLGSRSILADPRSPSMQKNLNLKIKFRESFRPFAPVVLQDKVKDWFEIRNTKSPYMLFVYKVRKEKLLNDIKYIEKKGFEKLSIIRSEIPAVTHVDNSARVQTIDRNSNKLLYDLILKFEKKTNCPMLVNTSFNVRGEPIVNSPRDAFECFMGTNLDILVVGNFYLAKKNQKNNLISNYKNKFNPD